MQIYDRVNRFIEENAFNYIFCGRHAKGAKLVSKRYVQGGGVRRKGLFQKLANLLVSKLKDPLRTGMNV